jgi:hypothetical protein
LENGNIPRFRMVKSFLFSFYRGLRSSLGVLAHSLLYLEIKWVDTQILREEAMTMIKMVAGILVSGLILGTVVPTYAGPFTRREARQQARIARGTRSGELTSREFRRLEQEQAAIEAHRRMAWSDGTLSPWEARHLTRKQNRVSRDIWRSKYNGYHW